MGDPKKLKKKYETPNHPWNKTEIDANKELRREFGLRNRREILVAESFLKKYKNLAKRLIANQTAQGAKEKEQIMGKLQQLGLLQAGADLNSILNLHTKDVLERRLQTLLARKGLCRTMKQARQFVTHRHVRIGDKEITSPGFLVSLEQETHIQFKASSALADEAHPEREIKKPVEEPKVESAEETKVDEAPAEPAKEEPVVEKAVEETKVEEKAAEETKTE